MPLVVRAVRGATTLDEDNREHLFERVKALFSEILDRNGLGPDDLISVFLTATSDIHSAFPAEAARSFGLPDVPLLGAQEIDVDGAMPLCIRVMAHVYTERSRQEIRHVYLEGAKALRRDLADG